MSNYSFEVITCRFSFSENNNSVTVRSYQTVWLSTRVLPEMKTKVNKNLIHIF